LYLLHVMHPDTIDGPGPREEFPRLRAMFARGRDVGFHPPLKANVTVGKLSAYHKDVPTIVLETAQLKHIDLICMAARQEGPNLAWWSAGSTIERIVTKAPCSVLVVRGRSVKPENWQRPRFRHILLLTEFTAGGEAAVAKVLPWVQRFESMLHIFPLVSRRPTPAGAGNTLRKLGEIDSVQTNVLLFAKPDSRMRNLFAFMADQPVDLIAMAPQTRATFSPRIISDLFVRLLRGTDKPILLLR
jgi:hypothetical protein